MSDLKTDTKELKEFKFHGTAREYFGIWIVNILLSVLTLGIYTAWAKVRTKRYFYGNAELDGSRFSYLATPKQILIGRIIVVVFLIVYNIAVNLFPIAGIVLSLALLIALPELVRRGIRFNARVSAYRNVRFDFVGTYGGAFLAIILGPLLAMITLGLAAPVSTKWSQSYITNNLRYGGRPYEMTATIKNFYKAFWLPFFLFIIALILLSAFIGVYLTSAQGGGIDLESSMHLFLPIYIATLAFTSAAGFIYAAAVRNIAFNATTIDGKHEMLSNISRKGYVWLMVSNFVVTLLTLGLMRPWAAVRHAKFLAEATAINVSGDLNNYTDSVRETNSSFGSEYMDIDGIEMGL